MEPASTALLVTVAAVTAVAQIVRRFWPSRKNPSTAPANDADSKVSASLNLCRKGLIFLRELFTPVSSTQLGSAVFCIEGIVAAVSQPLDPQVIGQHLPPIRAP
jgi:hypothetical protein